MKAANEADEANSQRYETIFCIFLVVLVFLYRDNTHLIYPQILYLFLILLTLNLAASLTLRLWPARTWTVAGIILSNCAVITGILAYSGEAESNLWPLYLLPIYTVCMLLNGGEVVWILIGIISFNAGFYGFSVQAWDATMLFDLALKSGIFTFAAGMTWKIVQKDRKARERLKVQRSEIFEMEEKIKQSEDHLKESERMADMGQLASGIAHDLNNPIAVIVGTINIMLEDTTLADSLKPDLERIARSAQLCRTITANVLNFAREKDLTLVPCDIHDILNSSLAIYENSLQQSGIRIEKNFAEVLPPVAASAIHLQRVFLNLMSNARSVMKSGGLLQIKTETLPPPAAQGFPWVQVVIEDNGPGIPPHTMANIFKPFNTTKGPNEGTGLGLYLSREIAIRHYGGLRAENKPEGGARFVLSLPSAESKLAAA